MSQSGGASPTHIFEALPKDDVVWEVVMHGRIHQSDVGWLIEVLIADSRWRERLDGHGHRRTRLIYTPIGDIVRLATGTFWLNQEPAPLHRLPPRLDRDTKIQEIEVSNPSARPTDSYGDADPTGKGADRPAYPVTGMADAPVWRIRIGPKDDYYVSAIDVIRHVFGPSSEFLKLTVEGGIEKSPSFRRRIFDIRNSGRALDDAGKVIISAYRDLSRNEAGLVARIATNRRMYSAFFEVFRSVQRSRNREPVFPTTLYPYDRPTRWRVEWRWTRVTPNLWRKIIVRIHHIEAPIDFRHIEVRVTRPDRRQDDGPVRVVRVRGGHRIPDRLPIRMQEASASDLQPISLSTGDVRHDPGFTLQHVRICENEADPVVVLTDEETEIEAVSTAWSSGGGRPVAAANFVPGGQPEPDVPRPPSDLQLATQAAIERLASTRGWACLRRSPPTGPGADLTDGLYRYEHDPKSRSRWTRMADGRLRRALIMQLTTEHGIVCLFDAEQQEIDGVPIGDQQALGVVQLEPGTPPPSYEYLQDFLWTNAEQRGIWRQRDYPEGFFIERRTRSRAWRADVGAYADHIGRTIARLQRLAKAGRD